jgi:hypothetical protein
MANIKYIIIPYRPGESGPVIDADVHKFLPFELITERGMGNVVSTTAYELITMILEIRRQQLLRDIYDILRNFG